ncbi:PAS domain S-box protein [Bradyrhizobium sp. LHD-71]|uniref:PAS domain-containing protein n=1 Tax=Bradyrhizobium sp. LHD-71 TaxID=3072141 RepID=UPI00280D2176|nr:PAS domain S-box protein [Bradyrhizobium sp. LHD-71]MDQ8728425.1 PAS domain S-box protein [Bradyrhizobium sp. LHD-71]
MDVEDVVRRAILSMESDAIVASDKDGRIVFWNPGAERIFGYASAHAVGQSLDIIIPERLRKRHWNGYRYVMEGGDSRYGKGDLLAVPAIASDGRNLSVEFTIVPLKSKADDLMGFVAIMRDVTSRFEETRELRRKLAEASK